jgi:hypothetical protein
VRKLLIVSSFVLGNFSILLISFLFLTIYTTKGSSADSLKPLEIEAQLTPDYSAYASETPKILKQEAFILAKDSRADLVDAFFRKYGSPMTGLGKDIVSSADIFKIPYGYLPAIGACEGALGQRIPLNSFNTWGWGVYGGKIKAFSSWQEAINIVSKGLKEGYFDIGLDTPEEIMAKYTPPSKGSWAACVNRYLEELK